jgi:hypothetical protein
MNPLTVFKFVAELAVSAGVGSIVSSAAKLAVPANAKMVKKISIGVGAFVLSNMVADQAVKYTSDKIDYGVDEFNKIKDTIAENKENNNAPDLHAV